MRPPTPFWKIAETGGSYAYIKFADVNEKLAPLLREAVIDSKRSVRDALAEMERQANLVLSQVTWGSSNLATRTPRQHDTAV